jgi:hypothetical protein
MMAQFAPHKPECRPRYEHDLRLSSACKRCEQATPAAFAVEDAAHLVTIRPVAIKMAMLQLDARTPLPSAMKRTSTSVFRFGSCCQSALISPGRTRLVRAANYARIPRG